MNVYEGKARGPMLVPEKQGKARKLGRSRAARIAALIALVLGLVSMGLLWMLVPLTLTPDTPVPRWLEHGLGMILVAVVAVGVALVRKVL